MDSTPTRMVSHRTWGFVAAGTALLTLAFVHWSGTRGILDAIVTVLLAELFLASCALVLCVVTERLSATYLVHEELHDHESETRPLGAREVRRQLVAERQARRRRDSSRADQRVRAFLRQVRCEAEDLVSWGAVPRSNGPELAVHHPEGNSSQQATPVSQPLPTIPFRRAA